MFSILGTQTADIVLFKQRWMREQPSIRVAAAGKSARVTDECLLRGDMWKSFETLRIVNKCYELNKSGFFDPMSSVALYWVSSVKRLWRCYGKWHFA